MSITNEAGVKALLEGFPKQPKKIVGKPNYQKLNDLMKDIKENAASVPCPLGGGNHGYLGTVLTPAHYATIVSIPFAIPANPGAHAVVQGPNVTARDAEIRLFNMEKALRTEYLQVTSALRKQILNAVDATYYKALQHVDTGYTSLTLQALLEHLFNKHGKINPADLALNEKRMTEAWDGTKPFEMIIKRLDECIAFADAGNDPYTSQQVINKAITIVFKMGLYNEAVREWSKLPAVGKMYAALQSHFIEAQEQYEEEQANMQQAGFGANVLVEAVQNVANMVVSSDDKTQTVLENLAAQMQIMQRENAELRALLTANNNNNTHGGCIHTPATNQGSYCWSHGYLCHKDHNSSNCHFPKPGHLKEATRENNKGGNQRGKPTA